MQPMPPLPVMDPLPAKPVTDASQHISQPQMNKTHMTGKADTDHKPSGQCQIQQVLKRPLAEFCRSM